MQDTESIIEKVVAGAHLTDRYDIDEKVPDGSGRSIIRYVKPRYGANASKTLLLKIRHERLNLPEWLGLLIMSACPGAIRSPRLIEPEKPEEVGSYTIQEFIIGTPLDTMIRRIPESFDAEYGKWLAWQMFPPGEDIRKILKDKAVDHRFDLYPKTEVKVPDLIPSKAPPKGQKPTLGNPDDAALVAAIMARDDFGDFLSILSAESIGFYKGDWRLSRILYNAEISATEFYSIDYGHGFVMPQQYDRDKTPKIRVAPFNTILKELGAERTNRAITAFMETAKKNLAAAR